MDLVARVDALAGHVIGSGPEELRLSSAINLAQSLDSPSLLLLFPLLPRNSIEKRKGKEAVGCSLCEVIGNYTTDLDDR